MCTAPPDALQGDDGQQSDDELMQTEKINCLGVNFYNNFVCNFLFTNNYCSLCRTNVSNFTKRSNWEQMLRTHQELHT